MNWYYADAGQQAGPVDDSQLEDLVRIGKIQADTLVWHEGLDNWLPYSQAKTPSLRMATPSSAPSAQSAASPASTSPVTGAVPEAVCIECGRMFSKEEMIRHGGNYVCAGCKPVFMQKLAEGAKLADGALNYAGFWIRFAAKFVDGLILGVPFMAVFFFIGMRSAQNPNPSQFDVLPLLAQLGFYFLNMLYTIFFLGKYGATPGKMVCKLQVVTADGAPISYGRAAGRFFAEILSGMVCYIGYLMVAFDSQKRALHDHICNTRVVYK